MEQPLYQAQRHEKILELLDMNAAVRVTSLAEALEVSEATIRKDLSDLESQGKLRRTHGGAIKLHQSQNELLVDVAATLAREEKHRIGQAAAQYVQNGDSFIIQSGTTTLEFLKALKGKKNLTMLCCDMQIATLAESILRSSQIIFIGGEIRAGYHYTQGTETIRQLTNYHVPTAFLCANAFSLIHGFSAHQIEQAHLMAQFVASSSKHIMLLDSTKFDTEALYTAFNLDILDVLISDTGVPESMRQEIAERYPDLETLYV